MAPPVAPTSPPPADRAVALEEMLAARDRRAKRQRSAIARHAKPVVSLTVVMPGPVKDTALTRRLLAEGLAATEAAIAVSGWTVLERNAIDAPTGPEALLAVDAPAEALKRCLLALEETHTLGRLWDIDVLATAPGSGEIRVLSRRDFGLPPRTCLLCGAPAHVCARSRAHPVADLVAAIESRADAYFRRA